MNYEHSTLQSPIDPVKPMGMLVCHACRTMDRQRSQWQLKTTSGHSCPGSPHLQLQSLTSVLQQHSRPSTNTTMLANNSTEKSIFSPPLKLSACPPHVHDNLVASAKSASRWYGSNFLRVNLDKYKTATLENKNDPMESIIIIIDEHEIATTNCLKLHGLSIDNNRRFDENINTISKRISQRVGVLMRLKDMISTDTKLQLFKEAILPYLTYCHLIWHFYRASDVRKARTYTGKST